MTEPSSLEPGEGLDIAIVGMAGRFPGAGSVSEFWRNLRDGVESVRFFTDQELLEAGVDAAQLKDPNYIKAAPILDDIESFDAAFFDFTPSEARFLDPQRRLFLECAWEALEDSGYVPESVDGAVGVYASVGANLYFVHNLAANPEVMQSAGVLQLLLSSDKDYFATQVSYKLNLTGPSLNVQTACSSSLVAIHLARQSLLLGECDVALAGGASINIPHVAGYLYQEGDIFAPDGHCRAFDTAARGTIFGSGCGVIALKRLRDALADGDRVRAVIKGSAINNDGSHKIGYTAPSVEGQAEVIVQAMASAGISPDTVSYIEAHGTGTELGDPIEVAALTQAFRTTTLKTGYCALGSVKTNVGHLNTAAGVAGVIKTALALENGVLPPSLNYETPNPKIDFASCPFYVNAQLRAWEADPWPRRAGVSSLGMGGTNAHVVLEEAPARPDPADKTDAPGASYLLLSARTPTALEAATDNLVNHLDGHPDLPLESVAYTLQRGRRGFGFRRGLRCSSLQDAVQVLRERQPGRLLDGRAEDKRAVVFLFPGQGSQHVGMGKQLYERLPSFRHWLDLCAETIRPWTGADLREVLFAGPEGAPEAAHRLEQTRLAQPALFAVEYALARVLMEWGVQPAAMIGHSLGEYVAACLAGVFSLEDALRLVTARGELMQSMPAGAMLSVLLSADEVAQWLDDGLSVAAINAPDVCVISGSPEKVASLQGQLGEAGVGCRPLRTSHAFHSDAMDPVVPLLIEHVARAALSTPAIPYVSNLTGDWVAGDEVTHPDYWGHQLRQPVQLAKGIATVLDSEPDAVLLEVGPGRSLSTLARLQSGDRLCVQAMGTAAQDSIEVLEEAVLQMWLAGVPVLWESLSSGSSGRRVPLPTYPFERKRFWVDPPDSASSANLLGIKKPDIANWFYLPSWRLVPRPLDLPVARQEPRRRLVFTDGSDVGFEVAARLRTQGDEVITVEASDTYVERDAWTFELNPDKQADYQTLVSSLLDNDKIPDSILHFWCLTRGDRPTPGNEIEFFQAHQQRGFYSLFYLVRALGGHNVTSSIDLLVLGDGLHDVTGHEQLHPGKATLIGQCKVVQQEYHNLVCRTIDAVPPKPATAEFERLISNLLEEIAAPSTDVVVALRGSKRWVQTYEALEVDARAARQSPISPGSTYLVTGGLFGIGQEISTYLALRKGARLILVEETGFPPEDRWNQWLQQNDPQHLTSLKVQKALELRESGAEILVARSDYHDKVGMQAAISAGEARFGAICGVIHGAGGSATDRVGAISDTSAQECRDNLASIAEGMIVLDDLLKDRDLDFRLALGSLGSILGGIGFVSYGAASSFLVAYAQALNRTAAQPWLVECWDSWTVEWETEERIASIVRSKLAERIMPTVITQQEGLDCFERIFALAGQAQVAISATDLQARYDQWVKLRPIREQKSKPVESSRHPRPPLKTAYVEPRDTIEQTIAEVWQGLLGIERVGVFDNFYDLGGHSLLATQLATRLRETFGMEFSLNAIAAGPTVSNLASAYAARQAVLKIMRQKKAKLASTE